MEDEIIDLLLKFQEINYHQLYLFLSYDKRVIPFSGYAQYVDTAITLKQLRYPKSIYNMLCENEITPWNISEELLYNAISDKKFIIKK